MFQKDDLIHVKIEKLVYGGNGLARHESLVVFVPFSAPGDELEVKVTKVKKHYLEAQIHKILNPGNSRVKAPCPSFGLCGGCQWQHISYEEQIKQKQNILSDLLKQETNTHILPMVASSPFEYRNRIQVRGIKNQVGFFQKGSHQVISAEECKIIKPNILEEIKKLKNQNHKKITKYELYSPDGDICYSSMDTKHGEAFGFSQVNDEINEKLLQFSLDWVKSIQPTRVYDLYCGKGNFSQFLQKGMDGLKVTGIDISKKNIEIAKKNAAPSSEYICSDAKKWLETNTLEAESLVIIDPPRIGCEEGFLRILSQSKAKHILYISCNPSTFLRDWKRLQEFSKNNYLLEKVLPLDMFPQTYHFEILAHIRLI